MPRRLPSFIDSFVEYASVFNAPERYLRWAGMFMATSMVTRGVGVAIRGNFLAPNLYIMMVGGPSVGKSQTTKAVASVLQAATDITFIPKSMTRAGMQDFMAEVKKWRRDADGGKILSNEFVGISDELQGILPDQDLGHLTMYNELYDLPKIYNAVTRTNGEVRLEYPYCSLLTGVQPQFLSLTMPEGAWGMGFMSRTVMVFGMARKRKSAFTRTEVNKALHADLVHDAKAISALNGYMKFAPDAVELYERWWVEHGGNPIPKAKRLVMGYNGRRELHVLKMAMGFSIAAGDSLMVEEEHMALAIEMLLEAEQNMQHIFNEMAASGSMIAIEDALDLVRNNAIQNRDTTEAQLIDLLMQRFPATQVQAVINNLLGAGAIVLADKSIIATGFRKFKPGAGGMAAV